MKPTFDIVMATAELFYRFSTELPEKYMQEVFGKDDPVLAEKCLQYPKKNYVLAVLPDFQS